MNLLRLVKSGVSALALVVFSVPALAAPIEALENGKFQVEICNVNGNQLGKNRIFNFLTPSGRHVTGGRTNDDQCVVTKISGLDSGDTVILEVEKSNGGLHRGSYTLPKLVIRNDADLSGSCPDNVDFQYARDFAYGSQGLNMDSRNAGLWAENYGQTHACGTIGKYIGRFNALFSFAYNTSTMNMSAADARRFASANVEIMTTEQTFRMSQNFVAIRAFAYDSMGLNLSGARSIQIAKEWTSDRRCEDAQYIQQVLTPSFLKAYEHAYSRTGLDMSAAESRSYALNKISALTRCSGYLTLY